MTPKESAAQLEHKTFFIFSRKGFSLFLLAAIPLCLCLVWFFVRFAEQKAAAGMAATARDRLILYSGSLNSALNKYSYLPHILATNPAVKRLMTEGDNRDAVNRYLEDINAVSGSMALFVLNVDGVCIATSNWNLEESFAGHDYNYRPYFQDAMRHGYGGYFGVGATTGKPGFFFTQRIEDNGRAVGVAVTKVDLSMLQREWRIGGETVFIADENGIIFLSSRDDWRYRATRPLTKGAETDMLYQRQYGNSVPPRIGITQAHESGVDVLEMDGSRWIYTARPIDGRDWTIWFLTPLTQLERQREAFWFIGVGSVFMLLLLALLARTYFAWARAKRAAREAEKIRRINTRLEEEVRIRKETERELLAAQDDLLHASRMAALGQVAASVAHELSQPVTSMRMFAASCKRFAEEGQREKVTQTLGHMLALVDRIKALIDQLKHFSRKAPGKAGPVALNTSLANALSVLQFQQEKAACVVTVSCPENAVVMADAMQLDQVCINLILNALDAVSELDNPEDRRVTVNVKAANGTVVMTVADSGPGVDPDDLEKIFTPFFTTKKSGEGIGLGLAIVENTVRVMHGEINVSANAPCGAAFTVTLPAAPEDGAA
ncbi:MAG: C4-dicarboxylate transport sensor protein DctB [Desulfovibrio sp.]